VLRIDRFIEQNGQMFVVGAVVAGVPDQSGAASNTSLVTQVVVPVLAVRSASSNAALNLGGASTPASAATSGTGGSSIPGTVGTTGTASAGTSGTTSGVGFTAATTSGGTGGVPASTTPGQLAGCGPLHVEVGPVTVTQSNLAFRLDRVAVDIAPPLGVQSPVNQMMCSADGALSQASGTGLSSGSSVVGTTGTASTTTGTTSTTGTTPGTTGMTGAVATGATTSGTSGAAGTTGTTVTPLQALVSALNDLVEAF
jgi:hypothetical protein